MRGYFSAIPGSISPSQQGYDPATNRYYGIRQEINQSGALDYLDANDWTWTTVSIGSPAGDDDNKTAFIVEQRRLLIMQTSTGRLRAINLNNPGAGVVTLRNERSFTAGQSVALASVSRGGLPVHIHGRRRQHDSQDSAAGRQPTH